MKSLAAPNSNPLVSIIIPCWNAERFIAEAIESALAQTYTNIEVIVIDDGSTDRCLEIIKSFGERIRWETGPNRGACAARNRGIDLAHGEFIQFLDADDLLHPDKIQFQVKEGKPTRRHVVTSNRFEKQFGIANQYEVRAIHYVDPFIFFLENHQLQTSSPLLHRGVLMELGGFNPSLTCCQEFEIHLRVGAIVEKVIHVDKPLFTVRKRPDSLSADYKSVLNTKGLVLQEAVKQLGTEGTLTLERRSCLAAWMARTAQQLIKTGSKKKGVDIFLAARQLDDSAAYDALSSRHKRLARIIGFSTSSSLFSLVRSMMKRACI